MANGNEVELPDSENVYLPSINCIHSKHKNMLSVILHIGDIHFSTPFEHDTDYDEKSVYVTYKLNDQGRRNRYALMVKLPVASISEPFFDETRGGNRLFIDIRYEPAEEELTWFMFGVSESSLVKRDIFEHEIKTSDSSDEEPDDPNDQEVDYLISDL